MDYSGAIHFVASGKRARRPSWPVGAFLILVPGSTITVDADRPLGQAAPELVGQRVRYRSHVDYFENGELEPWQSENDDRNARDWEII